MRKEEKKAVVANIIATLKEYENFYLTNIEALNAEKTSELRRECFKSDIKLLVVKNTLLKKALDALETDFSELDSCLKGNTAVMFSNVPNGPAKLIEKMGKDGVPSLKAAYVQESFYIGAQNLKPLVNIKSKNELIGDVIAALQAPAKNVISALQSGGSTLHGVLETLSKK